MTTSSNKKNIQLILAFVVGIHFLFVAVSHYHAAAARYESSQPFEYGLMANGTIVQVPEHSSDGTLFRFKDDQGQVRESRALVYYPEYLRVGQSYSISYEPDNTAWVRVPSLGWTKSEYSGWRLMTIIWMLGAIGIFPLALWHRFRTPPIKPEFQIAEHASEFRLKQNYLRLIILWAIYAFGLFTTYAIVTLGITFFLPLPPLLEKLALFGWHLLLFLAVGIPAVRILFNDPLKITPTGLSIYGRRETPWKAMSQIQFASGGKHPEMSWRLIVQLKSSSGLKGFPASGPALRKLSPLVFLDLYVTRWDKLDLIEAINHFGLTDLDPVAAAKLESSVSDSGLIGLCDKADTDDDEEIDTSKRNYYMDSGFHVDGHS